MSEIYSFFQQKIIKIISSNLEIKNKSSLVELLILLSEIDKEILFKENFVLEIINKLYSKINTENQNIIYNTNTLIVENKNLKKRVSNKVKDIIILNQDLEILKEKCELLNEENKHMTNKIYNVYKEEEKIDTSFNNTFPKVNKKTNMLLNSNDTFNNTYNTYNNTYNNTFNNTTNSTMVNVSNYRRFTKESLIELINEIYKSKKIADKKLNDSGKSIQSMEQYMYTFLNQKYGLKNITIEIASQVVQGIKDYYLYNNEICLFGLILRNEMDEGTIDVVNKIKEVIDEQLLFFIKEKYPHKDYEETQEIKKTMKNSLIDEDIWNNIVIQLFKGDQNNINEALHAVYNYINQILKKSSSIFEDKSISKHDKLLVDKLKNYPKKISYYDFFNVILGIHINLRKRYLKNVIKEFKLCDQNKDGFLTKEEFYKFIIELKIFNNDNKLENNINSLILKVKEINNIPFNEVINLLQIEKIDENNSLLEKVCNNI